MASTPTPDFICSCYEALGTGQNTLGKMAMAHLPWSPIYSRPVAGEVKKQEGPTHVLKLIHNELFAGPGSCSYSHKMRGISKV